MRSRGLLVAALVGASVIGGTGVAAAAPPLVKVRVNLSSQEPPDPTRCIGVAVHLSPFGAIVHPLSIGGATGIGELPPNPCVPETRG